MLKLPFDPVLNGPKVRLYAKMCKIRTELTPDRVSAALAHLCGTPAHHQLT
jgi:hypothetical protein